MIRGTSEAFVDNLKHLNAKERDHLMRLAYLGEGAKYEESRVFISAELDRLLRRLELGERFSLSESATCVFAGMDYHLDWLFAALSAAVVNPGWRPTGDSLPPVPMEPFEVVDGIKPLYTDFRPVTGSQEDIDLLVVYSDGARLLVLVIEAKGSAKFDKVQLARKLIRLDRILVRSGMLANDRPQIDFRFVLAAPKSSKPKESSCVEYAKSLPPPRSGTDKFRLIREALENLQSGIGDGVNFLELDCFPKNPYAVTRLPEGDAFSHWTWKPRR